MTTIFYPAGSRNNNQRNRNLNNITERVENEAIRKKIGDRVALTDGDTTGTEQLLELLRVATDDRESPYNRSRLFALGEAGSGKEALLSSLFDLDLKEDTSGDMQPIILGRYIYDGTRKKFVNVKNDNANEITIEVWNYSWKAVYNYLQDLFMTNYAVYLFCYDMKKILSEDEKVRNAALTYLEDILHTKKLHAPRAPVILVGTNRSDLTTEDIRDCEMIIREGILKTINFQVRRMSKTATCAAVCCESGEGIEQLAYKIHSILWNASFGIVENVPNIILKAETKLRKTGLPFMSYNEAKRILNLKDDDLCELLLKILSDRGVITFLYKHEQLRRFIVLSPEWLIRACGVAIYKDGKHKVLDFDIDNDQIVADFNIFVYQRVLSRSLLFHVLGRMNYPEEVHGYILDLMKSTCMVADYHFDQVESYLTPTFFDNLRGRNYVRKDIINEDDYKGPYFVIDFSGDHTHKVAVKDGGLIYSTFLPFSFFEKLVSLSIQLSASFGQGIQPITRYKKARLSFGAEVDFMMSVVNSSTGRPIKIKVSTLTGTSQDRANDLLERIFSMARGIRKDFYPGLEGVSILALSVLVPPSDDSFKKLTNYEEIQRAKGTGPNVIPNFRRPGNLPISEFDRWHRGTEPLKVGKNITFVPRQADGNFPLPDGKTQHCFLSYKETSALKEVERQLNDLKALGYICWLNKEYKGDLTLEVYLEEVKKSMCFILVLSVDVFESPIIIEELRTAIAENIPIIFLHHPDTDKLGYWTFSQYITSCPADLRHLFNEVDSIPLHRRFYLQEAVTNNLVRKISKIINQSNE